MRNLGFTALSKTGDRDLQKIAEIIREEEFDIVALQEVLSSGKAFNHMPSEYIKNSILMELGGMSNWGFEWANVGEKQDFRGEGFAFLWNKKKVGLAETKLLDNSTRVFQPRVCKIKDTEEMIRRPFYARFTPQQGIFGGPNFEIRLLCVHTYYGNDTIADRVIRQREIDILLKNIYPQIADRVYKGYMPSYTIVLGDYNVELKRSWKEALLRPRPAYLVADDNDNIETTKWGKSRKIKTIQDQFTTLKQNTENAEITAGSLINDNYAHDYDHFSYEESMFEGVSMKVKRVDAVRKYCESNIEEYRKKVSDHVPIMMEIELR